MTLTPPSSRTSGTTGTEILDGGAAATILDGDSANLAFARDTGDVLLDYTDPTAPTVIDAGVYAIMVRVQASTALTAGGSFEARVTTGSGVILRATSPAATATVAFPMVVLTAVGPLDAGDTIVVRCDNDSGATEDFNIGGGAVTRLS